MGNPFDFAKPVIKFNKLDDLPKGKPNTQAEVMKAMLALFKMVHAQAEHYGGKNGILLPVGIAEGSLLQQVSEIEQLDEASVYDAVENELEYAYRTANELSMHMADHADEKAVKLLIELIGHINRAISLAGRANTAK